MLIKPLNVSIIAVYALAAQDTEEEVDDFYNTMEKFMVQCKTHKGFGKGREGETIGKCGLDTRSVCRKRSAD